MFVNKVGPFVIFATCLALSTASALNPTGAQCNATFTDCAIPEETPLDLPFLAISGDVAVVPDVHANLAAIF